jgi:hypothetical protein
MRSIIILLVTSLLVGCVGPPALHKSVLGYDVTTNQLEQEILLLNIARLSHEAPVHFTMTGSIAATFDFTTSGNFSGSIVTSPGDNIFNFGMSASASENPTLSIVPISGEDFTKRVVTPFLRMPSQNLATRICLSRSSCA